jgi:hypothetical protein
MAREFLKSAPQGKVGKIYMPVGKVRSGWGS